MLSENYSTGPSEISTSMCPSKWVLDNFVGRKKSLVALRLPLPQSETQWSTPKEKKEGRKGVQRQPMLLKRKS
jgi:hypothetical protein